MNFKLLNILDDWSLWPFCHEPIRPESIVPLAGGLTNDCYCLTLASGRYVLRIAGGQELGIRRDVEYRLHKQLANQGLTPAIRYCAPDFSYWVRDYVDGTVLAAADLTLTTLTCMVAQLKTLHQLTIPSFVPEIHIAEKAEHYWREIQMLENDPALLKLKDSLQQALRPAPSSLRTLCHMDPTAANWIVTSEQKLILLDWEYSAVGHPLWDIAGLIQQAQLSKHEEQQLLASYGWQDQRSWQLAKAQIRYLEVLWYRAQNIYSSQQLQQALRKLKSSLELKV